MKYLIIAMIFSNSLWSQNLDQHKWQDRVLIIRGVEADADLVEQQFNTFIKIQEQLLDRKLVLYKCIDNSCTLYDWKQEPRPIELNSPTSTFEIVLIGLDGGTKFKSDKLIQPQEIFDLIDQMPMRRRELKSKKNKN